MYSGTFPNAYIDIRQVCISRLHTVDHSIPHELTRTPPKKGFNRAWKGFFPHNTLQSLALLFNNNPHGVEKL